MRDKQGFGGQSLQLAHKNYAHPLHVSDQSIQFATPPDGERLGSDKWRIRKIWKVGAAGLDATNKRSKI